MNFDFATAHRIVFGRGSLAAVAPAAAALGRRALLVGGATPARVEPLAELLHAAGVETIYFAVDGEPTVETAVAGVGRARAESCDLIVGMGGGSALDAGKAIAVLLSNPGDVYDYLEVIGRGRPLTQTAAPYIAVPTTAGAGTEVTRNAVLKATAQRVKVSLRSASMLPRLAVIDPELTRGLPPAVTAATGLDALTQCIEPFVSNRANPMTDGFCREGMARAARSLRRAYQQGDDMAAREDMALAALCGGLALANARLGAVHGFAGPLGGMFPAPHGAVCARLLPLVMAANVAALEERRPGAPALARYGEVARILTGRADATAADGVAWVEALARDLQVPSLSAYGVDEAALPELVANSQRASSMQGNPIELSEDELTEILRRAL